MLNTALDLAVAALCIERRVRGGQVGEIWCEVCDKQRLFFEYELCFGRSRVVCWELVRRILVAHICWGGCLYIGQDGQLMLEEGQGLW